MHSQTLGAAAGSLAVATIALIAAAAMILALVIVKTSGAPVTSPTAARPAVTVVHAAPTASSDTDSSLPICKRHGGPTC